MEVEELDVARIPEIDLREETLAHLLTRSFGGWDDLSLDFGEVLGDGVADRPR